MYIDAEIEINPSETYLSSHAETGVHWNIMQF